MTEKEKQKYRALRFSVATADKLSFNSFNEFSEIIEDEFGPNAINMHRTKNTALVNRVLGPHFFGELLEDLHHEDALFSILTDETTDNTDTKFLTFSVRYYSPKFQAIKETHLDLTEICRATADLLRDATGEFEIFGIFIS